MHKVITQSIQKQKKCTDYGQGTTGKKTKEEIAYFEMLAQQVQQASPGDIEEIREELAEQGYLKMRHAKKKKKNNRSQSRNVIYHQQVCKSLSEKKQQAK